jgi:hypothetical protein
LEDFIIFGGFGIDGLTWLDCQGVWDNANVIWHEPSLVLEIVVNPDLPVACVFVIAQEAKHIFRQQVVMVTRHAASRLYVS